MNIIILGAGQVGATLAENLVMENNDITVVDTNHGKLRELQNRLDIRTVTGQCSYPNILKEAGADKADMLIAVTSNDESNMIACQVAHSLFNTPMKLARIRSARYFEDDRLFGSRELPIDVFISPEQIITRHIRHLIEYPGALQVLDFANGAVRLVAIKPYYGGPLAGKTLAALKQHIPNIDFRVVAIFRANRSIPLTSSTVIEIGDEVFFIAATEHIREVIGSLRRLEHPYKRIIIAGGGNIGYCLAKSLEDRFNVKLIESNSQRTEFLARELEHTTVLKGDCADRDLLLDENVDQADVFCALTNDDEANIMSSIQAKRLGVRTTMALITRSAYVDLIEGGDIDTAISPQQITIGSILKHLRRGDIAEVHSLRRGAAEAMEIIVHGDKTTSQVVGRRIDEIKLPQSAKIGALVREHKVLIAHRDVVIETGDHAIVFMLEKKYMREVERLFQVSAAFF